MFKQIKSNQAKYVFASATLAVLLAACGQATPTAAPATIAPAATSAPAVTTAPTSAPAATEATAAPAEATATTEITAATAPSATLAVTKINLNTATAEEILTVPNAGNRMVREFQEYRPYTSILQFRQEIGKYVDAAQVAEYEKYVYVPVSPNNADAATLQQLAGVNEATANQLIAARPYADKAAFLKKLGELTSVDQASSAAGMVEAQ